MGTDWISDHRCSFDLCAAALTGLEFDVLLINIGVLERGYANCHGFLQNSAFERGGQSR